MHTIDLGDGVFVHHNGDFSGDVVISVKQGTEDNRQYPRGVVATGLNGEKRVELYLPYKMLETIVARKIRDERISRLEEMSDKEVLELE